MLQYLDPNAVVNLEEVRRKVTDYVGNYERQLTESQRRNELHAEILKEVGCESRNMCDVFSNSEARAQDEISHMNDQIQGLKDYAYNESNTKLEAVAAYKKGHDQNGRYE